jgi:hypothetical protein
LHDRPFVRAGCASPRLSMLPWSYLLASRTCCPRRRIIVVTVALKLHSLLDSVDCLPRGGAASNPFASGLIALIPPWPLTILIRTGVVS